MDSYTHVLDSYTYLTSAVLLTCRVCHWPVAQVDA